MSETKWRGKNFLLTLNEVDKFDALKEYIKHFKTFNYAIATKEKAPRTNHEHIHIYCQFLNTTTLDKNKTENAHIDVCKGSAQQNIKYIRKDDEPEKRGDIIWEEGIPKYRGGLSIKEVKEMSKAEREALPFVYYKSVEKLNMQESMHMTSDDFMKKVEVFYIYGGSGLGKTTFVKNSLVGEQFDVVSFENGFWTGVTEDGSIAVYDDFRDTDLPGVVFIKFIDYSVKNLNIKGGYVKNKYKKIYITSIQDPRYIYDKEWEEKKQWLRRMRVYHFFGYNKYKELIDDDLGIEVYD